MKVHFLFILSVGMLLAIPISSCKKNKTSSNPAFPAMNTLSMDFGFIKSQKSGNNSVSDSSNYIISKKIVLFWDTVASKYTYFPVKAYGALVNGGESEYDADSNTWTWKKSFNTTQDQNFLATLSAVVEGDSITWMMKVQKYGENQALKYLEGVSKKDEGWWKLYTRVVGNTFITTPSLLVNWKKTNGSVDYLQYTNIVENNDNNGSNIIFGSRTSGTFDKYFTANIIKFLEDSEINSRTYSIEWNGKTREGNIQWTGTKRCWDTTLKNTTCP